MADPPPNSGDPDGRPRAAVFDIDGVLADVRHRLHHVAARPKDWDAFFGAAVHDPPLAEGLAAVGTAQRAEHVVVYLTGRPERCRSDTIAWLAAQHLPDGELLMRADRDRRPSRLLKVAALRRLSRHLQVAAFVDDDVAVVAAVRSAGFPALHAQWMQPSTSSQGLDGRPSGQTATEVLFEIQEGDART